MDFIGGGVEQDHDGQYDSLLAARDASYCDAYLARIATPRGAAESALEAIVGEIVWRADADEEWQLEFASVDRPSNAALLSAYGESATFEDGQRLDAALEAAKKCVAAKGFEPAATSALLRIERDEVFDEFWAERAERCDSLGRVRRLVETVNGVHAARSVVAPAGRRKTKKKKPRSRSKTTEGALTGTSCPEAAREDGMGMCSNKFEPALPHDDASRAATSAPCESGETPRFADSPLDLGDFYDDFYG